MGGQKPNLNADCYLDVKPPPPRTTDRDPPKAVSHDPREGRSRTTRCLTAEAGAISEQPRIVAEFTPRTKIDSPENYWPLAGQPSMMPTERN